jgi:hypothetical protein
MDGVHTTKSLISQSLAGEDTTDAFECVQWLKGKRLYDLIPLTKDNDFYQIKGNDSKEKLLFNFCKPFDASIKPEYNMCEKAERYGYLIEKVGIPGMKCEPLTDKALGEKVVVTEITEDKVIKGINIVFPLSEKSCDREPN